MVKALVFASLVAGAHAANASLRASVEAALGIKTKGPVNCAYKCGLMWNQRQDWGQPGAPLNEYLACIKGCNLCDGGENNQCMSQCKSVSWISYGYYWNVNTEYLGQIDNAEIAKPLTDCFDNCVATKYPTPDSGAGFDGKLPKSFTSCTTGCFDTHLDTVQSQTIEKCHAAADASGGQFTKDMCGVGLVKGVVEPDKACIQGCSQNLCQAGAGCNGKGYWVPDGTPDTTGCQLITPQTQGIRNTIKPSYFDQQNDLGDCCNAAFQRCNFKVSEQKPASFGVSLGRVIATSEDQCKMPGSTDTYGNVIQNSGDYFCNCKNFFKECPAAVKEGTIPAGFQCNYGNAPSDRCTSVDNCPDM